MLWTTLQGLIAHRFRLFATALAVTLGVAFTAGTFVLTDTVTKTFQGVFGEVYAGTDAVVRGEEQFEGPMMSGAQRPRVDAALVDVVREVDGVQSAQGSVLGYARIAGKDGEVLGNPNNGPPTFGANWFDDAYLNPAAIKDGRAPRAENEVVIDAKSAKDGELAIGDTTTVLVQGPPQQVVVVGTVTFGGADSLAGSTFVAFRDDVAQQLLAEPGRYNEISVKAADGVSQEEVTARVAAALPVGTEAITGEAITKENQDLIGEMTSFFSTFMLIFALIALLVGAFMIFNTFSITVAQRTRENGLLRALGASRRQVLGSVLVEAFVVGVIASVLGIAAGLGVAVALKGLLAAIGFDLPAGGLVFAPRTVAVSLVAGIGITLFAALSPARKAAKVAPIAAMQAQTVGSVGYGSKTRVAVGTVVLSAGAVALLTGLFAGLDDPLPLVGLGALAVFFGVSILGRTIALPLSRLIGAPLPRLRGLTGELARENAMRNPKRTAASASALMIGVGLVGFITIFVASTKASIDEGIDRAFAGDLVVDSGASIDGGLDPSLAEQLTALPAVDAATGLKIGPAVVDGDVLLLGALDPAAGFSMMDLQQVGGSLEAMTAADAIAVHQDTATDKGLELGDTVPVQFAETGLQDLTVAMLYAEELDANGPAGTFVLGTPTYEANFSNRFDWQVYVQKAPDAALADARASVDEVLTAYPGISVMDKEEFAASITSQVDQMLVLVYALLGLAILIALLGIGNTLALSIVERTRELGLLRAVGMTRSQLRSSIRWESVIIAVQGTLLGLVIGVFFGWALIRALADQGIEVFALPTDQLAVIVLLGALAGMLAAVLPSRRAARLDILRAVAAE
jgi:putative ABC transport system permease protein